MRPASRDALSLLAAVAIVAFSVSALFGGISGPGAAGGGEWALVERKELAADATTVTFSGLNANADGVYQLIFHINNNTSPTVSAIYTIRPNGVTADQEFEQITGSAGTVGASTGSVMRIGVAGANDRFSRGSAMLYLDTGPDADQVRLGSVVGCDEDGSDPSDSTILRFLASIWNDSTGNVTSLVVVSDQTNGLGDGTVLALFRNVNGS